MCGWKTVGAGCTLYPSQHLATQTSESLCSLSPGRDESSVGHMYDDMALPHTLSRIAVVALPLHEVHHALAVGALRPFAASRDAAACRRRRRLLMCRRRSSTCRGPLGGFPHPLARHHICGLSIVSLSLQKVFGKGLDRRRPAGSRARRNSGASSSRRHTRPSSCTAAAALPNTAAAAAASRQRRSHGRRRRLRRWRLRWWRARRDFSDIATRQQRVLERPSRDRR